MKAKLEFELPEEQEDLRDALDASKWRVVVREFNHFVETKYRGCAFIPINDIQEKLHALLQESGIEL